MTETKRMSDESRAPSVRERDPAATPPELDVGVLSTLNPDGSRHWIRPRLSPGRFLTGRRLVAYGLILLFTALPYVRIAGKPSVLLDIGAREFTVLGKTFLPTDTIVLALFLVAVFVSIFLITAILGRAWCGWACPHTVYMEFVYRPIERLFDGPPKRGGRPGTKRTPVRIVAKYATYLVISGFLAHVFLAYFVGVERLAEWIQRSPFEHPAGFLVVFGTTVLMMFHFSFFREQLCIVACPYGRLQSVMLDRESLIVAYDERRGEPRGKLRKKEPITEVGDCVDCNLCVETCPTGIDIRDGLKMECVHCAQCIDACDAVMEKIGKPKGLIRYSSQARMAGERARWLRPRVVLYPLVLGALAVAFSFALKSKSDTDVRLLRGLGAPYTVMNDGRVSNALRVKVTNRREVDRDYAFEVTEPYAIELLLESNPFRVEPGEARTESIMVLFAPEVLDASGREITIRIHDGAEFEKDLRVRLFGPATSSEGDS